MMSPIYRDQQLSLRQEAFQVLLDSLRSTEPARKPAAAVGPIEVLDEPAPLELPCEDCGGSGFDSCGLDPAGEICPHCQGSGVEHAATPRRVERAA